MIAGDIFDRWKVMPEVVNKAMNWFGLFSHGVYAIPGQHDLPLHNYRDKNKSSYWTLVQSKVIKDLDEILPVNIDRFRINLHPFPWGRPLVPCTNVRMKNEFDVAVIHKYVWVGGCEYKGAPIDQHAVQCGKELIGYSAAIFGDNHKGFLATVGNGIPVVNCGGFQRRKSDEKDYVPRYAVMYSDGAFERPAVKDAPRWEDTVVKVQGKGEVDVEGLLEVLEGLGEQSLDFTEAMVRYINRYKVGPDVKKIILKTLEP